MLFIEKKYINFNKNKAESKLENPTHSFKETIQLEEDLGLLQHPR